MAHSTSHAQANILHAAKPARVGAGQESLKLELCHNTHGPGMSRANPQPLVLLPILAADWRGRYGSRGKVLRRGGRCCEALSPQLS